MSVWVWLNLLATTVNLLGFAWLVRQWLKLRG
jgi:hypothetical protein